MIRIGESRWLCGVRRRLWECASWWIVWVMVQVADTTGDTTKAVPALSLPLAGEWVDLLRCRVNPGGSESWM